MNPIQNLWAAVKRNLRSIWAEQPPVRTPEEFWDRVLDVWEEMAKNLDLFHNLVDSMPRRMRAVVDAGKIKEHVRRLDYGLRLRCPFKRSVVRFTASAMEEIYLPSMELFVPCHIFSWGEVYVYVLIHTANGYIPGGSADMACNVKKHINSNTHKRAYKRQQNLSKVQHESPSQLLERSFYDDMCDAFIASNIPLNKLENAKLRGFSGKYTGRQIPKEATLRNNATEKSLRSSISSSNSRIQPSRKLALPDSYRFDNLTPPVNHRLSGQCFHLNSLSNILEFSDYWVLGYTSTAERLLDRTV
ncbi:hypothetical protein ANN_14489 [Periplaneta americana]|uniref:Uncharacterized protein n=1 Tax=Periplaneta americana TaxID=6978 RepID=A0ABQ8SY14_PERAM|nr:hypothetical protein ANN_14489 [Periplaneta americana]